MKQIHRAVTLVVLVLFATGSTIICVARQTRFPVTGNIVADSAALAAAISGKTGLGAGDTLMLAGGTHKGPFLVNLHGDVSLPVVIRSVPAETAVLTGTIELTDKCHDVVFMDFELTGNNNAGTCKVATKKGSTAKDVDNHDGMIVGAKANAGIRVINLMIHDVTGDGLSLWTRATGTEAYGNIIYNNGWDGPDRGHGHGIYTQNDSGTKVLCDNICFWDLGGAGIKVYTEHGKTRNYFLEGNIQFGDEMFLLGGYKPVYNLTLKNNYMGEGSRLVLGYAADTPNLNLLATGNYLMNTKMTRWRDVHITGNKFLGSFEVNLKGDKERPGYLLDSNQYFRNKNFIFFDRAWDLAGLQKLGYETHGSCETGDPTQNEVIVRANKYEKGRGHVVVYNWEKKAEVEADLAKVLAPGDEFAIWDVQNLSGAPVVIGKFTGQSISLPMELTAKTMRLGDFEGAYHANYLNLPHTSAAFGVYLVRKTNRGE
jgi:hypothetical protein